MRQEVEIFSSQIGMDPLLVQGAGGNVSWKEDGILWVKASGTWLKDARLKNIFVPVDLCALQSSIEYGDFSLAPRVLELSPLRPSIESLLHGLMPQRVVLHLHAIEVLSWMVRSNPIAELNKRLANFGHRWLLVNYQKPGADLAREIAAAIKQNALVDVVFMANHGVVLGGCSVDDVRQKLQALIEMLALEPLGAVNCSRGEFPQCLASQSAYLRVVDPGIEQLALDPRLFERIGRDWALYPDHVVFLGPRAYLREASVGLDQFGGNGQNAEILFIKHTGVFSLGELTPAKRAQLRCYYDVISRQSSDQDLAVLPEDAVSNLLSWDAEVYRQSIA